MLGMSHDNLDQNNVAHDHAVESDLPKQVPVKALPISSEPVIPQTESSQPVDHEGEKEQTGDTADKAEEHIETEGKTESTTDSGAGVAPEASSDKSAALIKEQLRYCATVLKGLKRHPQHHPFAVPVDPVALNIPDYFDVIKHPMDLSKISQKLETGEYKDAEGFIADVKLMLSNCFAYNHPDSQVAKMGHALEKYFTTAIGKMPQTLPVPEEDKHRRKSEPVSSSISATRVRRESHAPTRLATTTAGSTTPRSRPRSNVNPEMSFCNTVMRELLKKTHQAVSWPFLEPVDPIKLGIPDYFEVIKNPMDLSTVRRKLESGQYSNADQFETDIRQIFANCYLYNTPDSDVVGLCRAFEKIFEAKWAQKPSHSSYSGGSSFDDIDSDSEKILEINRQIQALQHELNSLLMKRKHRSSSTSNASRPKKISRPSSKPATPTITEEDFLSRPMTFEEKRQLSIEVNNLSPEKLGRVVEIIQAGTALEAKGDSDVIELDVESLNTATLRNLQRYVMECKGITSLAAILGDATPAKRKKSAAPKKASGTTSAGGAAPAVSAAAAAAQAMSSNDESSDEDLD